MLCVWYYGGVLLAKGGCSPRVSLLFRLYKVISGAILCHLLTGSPKVEGEYMLPLCPAPKKSRHP